MMSVERMEILNQTRERERVGDPEHIGHDSAMMSQWLPYRLADAGEYVVIMAPTPGPSSVGYIEGAFWPVIGDATNHGQVVSFNCLGGSIAITRAVSGLADVLEGPFPLRLMFVPDAGPLSARTMEPHITKETVRVPTMFEESLESDGSSDDSLPELPNDPDYQFSYGRPIQFNLEQAAQFRRMAESEPPEWFVAALARRKRR